MQIITTQKEGNNLLTHSDLIMNNQCIKRLHLTLVILSSLIAINLHAQDYLPQNYSLIFGGGLALSAVEGNKNDFFSKNGDRPGYALMAEGRYYVTPNLALGAQYDYLRAAHLPDKMHVHYIGPTVTLRTLWDNGNKSVCFALGIGYMDYRERVYQSDMDHGHLYQKSYCGISFGLGYEFSITKKMSGVLRLDMLTADWVANPDARLFNTDDYDDGIDHSWFKNNITFFNLGFALQFGR